MKILSAEDPYTRFFVQYSLPFLVIGIISRTFPLAGPVYYIVPVILLINTLLAIISILRTGKTLYYFLIIFVFPVYCLLTSVWSLSPIISLQRSLYLLLMYAGILSSVLLYKKYFFEKGIGFLIPANILVIVLSAVSLLFGFPVDRWSGGNGLGFMGFAGHQNILASALLFTFPGVFALRAECPAHRVKGPDKSGFPPYLPDRQVRSNIEESAPINRDFHPAYRTGKFVPTKSKAFSVFRLSSNISRLSFFIFLLTSNLLLLVLTYSRASLFAFAIGIITYLLILRSKKILAILLTGLTLLFVLYLTITPIKNSIDTVLNKDSGNILDRRTVLWEPSLEAAKMGGIFGLGYGVSAPDIKTPVSTGSHYEDGRYVREKGNSVLAMIEETGYIGLLLFLLPVFWVISKFSIFNFQFSIKKKIKSNYTFYIVNCTLLTMFVHAQFEGWWVGVGSITLPLYLIFLFMALLQQKSYLQMKN